MKFLDIPELEYLNTLFEYVDGKLLWKVRKSFGIKIGSVAGKPDDEGYYRIKIDGKNYRRNRLIWYMHNGEIPDGYVIDHIDDDPTNDRIENLRLATQSQNLVRKKKMLSNTSGFIGVDYNKARGKYRARIMVEGKRINLGYFDTPEEASIARDKEMEKTCGEYIRLNN